MIKLYDLSFESGPTMQISKSIGEALVELDLADWCAGSYVARFHRGHASLNLALAQERNLKGGKILTRKPKPELDGIVRTASIKLADALRKEIR